MSDSESVIRTLYQISTETGMSFKHQINRMFELGCRRFNLDMGILSKIDGNDYEVMHVCCPSSISVSEGDHFLLSCTFCAVTMSSNNPVCFEHIGGSEIKNHPAYHAFGLEAYIGSPIIVDGVVFGTLNFSSLTPHDGNFSESDVDTIQLMAAWVGSELTRLHYENALHEANRQLKLQATTDNLTNINNRHSLFSHMSNVLSLAERQKTQTSLLMIDIDYLKAYNDTYGHIAGDEMLVCIVNTIKTNVRSADILARYGGDEFTALLPCTEAETAMVLAGRILKAVADISELQCAVSVSIGVATIFIDGVQRTNPFERAQHLIDKADKALYHSKANGRGQVFHYNNI